jgi:hypothetical protein
MIVATFPIQIIAAPTTLIILNNQLSQWEAVDLVAEEHLTHGKPHRVLNIPVFILDANQFDCLIWIN